MADYHVLVLAMSTLKEREAFISEDRRLRKYQFVNNGEPQGVTYTGIGQLEALPQFISDQREASCGPHSSITHMIILATEDTLRAWVAEDQKGGIDPEGRTWVRLKEYHQHRIDLSPTKDNSGVDWTLSTSEEPTKISAVEFFVRRMKRIAKSSEFDIRVEDKDYIIIPISQADLGLGMGALQDNIRALYARYLDEGGDWKLWLDTHGAFREISMGMFGIMQMLAAPNKDEIKSYVEKDSMDTPAIEDVKSMHKSMGDGNNVVPVTGVYTVNFPDTAGAIASIVELTEFYANFIGSSVRSYLNYGQYVQMSHFPDAWLDEAYTQWRDDYVFVSYKHEHGKEGDSMPEVYTVLGTLRNAGVHYWYDDAIETGSNWRAELDDALDNCCWFLALLTEEYMESDQCKYELATALHKLDTEHVRLVTLDSTPMYGTLGADLCGTVDAGGNKRSYTLSADKFNNLKHLQQIELPSLIKGGAFQLDAAMHKVAGFGSSATTA